MVNPAKTIPLKNFRHLIVQPLLAQKPRLAVIAAALLLLSVSQSLFLFLVGPLVQGLLASQKPLMSGADLLPQQFLHIIPRLQELSVPRGELVVVLPVILVVAGVMRAVASYFYQLNQAAVALYVTKNYRAQLFAAILSLPFLKISEKSPAQWMSTIMNDVLFLQTRFSEVATTLLRDLVLIVSCIGALFIIHWPTALMLLLGCPVLAFFLGRVGRRIAYFAEQWQRQLAKISVAILDIRSRFEFIRAQHGERFEERRFNRLNDEYYLSIRRSILVRSAFAPGLEFFGFAVFAAFVFAYSRGVWLAGQSPELALQFFAAVGLLLRPLRNMGEQFGRYQETLGSLRQSLGVFAEAASYHQQTPDNPAAKPKALLPEEGLHIRQVVTGYHGDSGFRAADLGFPRGRSFAVIGASGAGKSTLLRTFSGLLNPSVWEANVDWALLMNDVSLVSQEPFLFDDTLRENLTYGLVGAGPTDAEIEEVLELVNIKQEVLALPAKLATSVRGLAANFSGGQIQRLVIARALLRRKNIWLFDEATSAIDTRTERDIVSRLLAACKSQRKLFVAVTHRLELLEKYDEVIFIGQGGVIAKGPHSELMKKKTYEQFCNAQQLGV